MKSYFKIFISLVFLSSCINKEDEILIKEFNSFDQNAISSECFFNAKGDDCFVLNLESISVDTIRFNLMQVTLRGDYNNILIPDSIIVGFDADYITYKNGNVETVSDEFRQNRNLDEGRYFYQFNYPFFAGYDSFDVKVRLRIRYASFGDTSIVQSYFTEYLKYNPNE